MDEAQLPTAQDIKVDGLSEPLANPTIVEQGFGSVYRWKLNIQDLFSKQSVTVRKVDVTTIALEGAAAGAVLVSLLVVLLKPK